MTFAPSREDAEKAMSLVKKVGGRPVQVLLASKKPRTERPAAGRRGEGEEEEEGEEPLPRDSYG